MATFTFIIALLFSSLQSESNTSIYTGDENTATYSDSGVSERGDFVGQTDVHPKP